MEIGGNMNQYVTGSIIKKLREERKMTQVDLAQKLCVSEKTISKWETGKGYPDIAILEDLAKALGISVIELLSGTDVTNQNKSFNMNRVKFYVCPVCGNVIIGVGEAVLSCCGVRLVPEEVEMVDEISMKKGKEAVTETEHVHTKQNMIQQELQKTEEHKLIVEKVEDEYYVTINHPMTKSHYISFIAGVRDNGVEFVKLYPEGNGEGRFKINRTKYIYFYCNRHGMFCVKMKKIK